MILHLYCTSIKTPALPIVPASTSKQRKSIFTSPFQGLPTMRIQQSQVQRFVEISRCSEKKKTWNYVQEPHVSLET